MPEPADLRPATAQKIVDNPSLALRYDGRRRVHHADTFMARITAERLIRHLALSSFEPMKKPPAPAHSAPTHHKP
jgi:hypothetical protein